MLKIIQSFFNMGEKIADAEKSIVEHRAESDIIKDKHNYKKATDIAERIIMIKNKPQPLYQVYFSFLNCLILCLLIQ